MLELHDLSKRFDGTLAVDRVSITVVRGACLVLLGGSGSGKTTTLKMVNRLVEPSSGRVVLGGHDTAGVPAPELRRRIGYCFQRVGLFPHLTVAENVGITPSLLGWDRARIARQVDRLLALVELEPRTFRGRRPEELSGGEQQRVGVARALAAEPEVVLLDEPFGALDPLTRQRLQASFRALRQRLGFTAIFVTHDVLEAFLLGDEVAVMREGRLLQVGTPADLVHRPCDDYVRDLIATPLAQADEVRARLARPTTPPAPRSA